MLLQEAGIISALHEVGLEKALGKPAFETAAAGLWEKLPGKPTLVPESDKRPPYVPAEAAFQAVSADG